MEEKVRKAIWESIGHWVDNKAKIVKGETLSPSDIGWAACALCKLFNYSGGGTCLERGCLLALRGMGCCDWGSIYSKVDSNPTSENAQKMIDALVSLLDEPKEKRTYKIGDEFVKNGSQRFRLIVADYPCKIGLLITTGSSINRCWTNPVECANPEKISAEQFGKITGSTNVKEFILEVK